jgi:NAD(P)-dependent dehydrogenase (short-subunit alcohol dehydrogenase family)
VDILVHNAGAFPEGSMDSQSLEEWQYVQRVNLESNFHLTKLLLPCLRESGDASVILVSSVVTKFGRGDSPTYTASKAGQIGLGRHMAAELGVDHVRVNLVLPGMVDTEGTRRVNTDERYAEFANELQMIPHPIQPQDLAETIVFLCTPAARAITGASIDVNGGLRV